MDNQNDINNSMQNPSNFNAENTNAQNSYVPNIQQNNTPFNSQQYNNFDANSMSQNYFVLNSMIDSLSGWMKFMGIYTIVIGALSCLGILTAAIGVPLIFAGIALNKGSANLKSYKQYQNPYVLNELFTSLNKYFKIQGILTIVTIVLSIIYIIFLIFVIVFAANSYNEFF